MNKYNLIIFDLDGTLADTSIGIINCHIYTHQYFNKPVPPRDALFNVIGGPLLDTYINVFGFKEEEAREAIKVYREQYNNKCVYEAELYEDMDKVLSTLKSRGYKLAVATLKADPLAKKLLKHLDIAKYFDLIKGVDANDKLKKTDLLNICIEELGEQKGLSVLVGDSIHDYNGTLASMIDFVAAKYGFGFNDSNLKEINAVAIAKTAKDLLNIFK